MPHVLKEYYEFLVEFHLYVIYESYEHYMKLVLDAVLRYTFSTTPIAFHLWLWDVWYECVECRTAPTKDAIPLNHTGLY
jgi:hypothetical protein